jgi:segregation and condensation protein A
VSAAASAPANPSGTPSVAQAPTAPGASPGERVPERGKGGEGRDAAFEVHLKNFSGPFDLLLQLISRHQLDVTEVALSQVTDEFLAYIKAGGREWDLDETSQFLVVAATLLDLKAARLLPSGEIEDAEDLALLEARDLLFARLLQYRAFKQVADYLARRFAEAERRLPRDVELEPRFAALLPEVVIGVSPDGFAALAARALTTPSAAPPDLVSLAHLHAPAVSVRDQAALIIERLRRAGTLTFRTLTADADRVTTVARFLALLELFKEGAVAFEQLTPLGELTVRWTGSDAGDVEIVDEYDEPGRPPRQDIGQEGHDG